MLVNILKRLKTEWRMLFTVLDMCVMVFIICKMILATVARKKKTGMAEGGDSSVQLNWRDKLISQLQNRNRQQCSCFQELITFHNRLFDQSVALRHENLQLTIQNERLRQESQGVGSGGSLAGSPADSAKISALEQKVLNQQEELTELHKRRGENAQLLIDLNHKLQEKEKQLSTKEEELKGCTAEITRLNAEIQMYQNNSRELESLNQMLKDEYQALQLALTHLEVKTRKLQDENREMVERLMKYKSKDAEKMNEENENFVRKKHAKLQKELEDAAKDMRGISPDRLRECVGPVLLPGAVPSKPAVIFDAHDSEVCAVRWSPVDHLVATGGADRKVKLWDISKGTAESKGMLVGCNLGVMSVDFDSTGTQILGASNDFASRIWTVADQRLRVVWEDNFQQFWRFHSQKIYFQQVLYLFIPVIEHTLTGHSAKVMAAKFLGESTKVVTGSHDRTLKIWDLRSKACTETKFAGSSCNDVVTSDGAGTTIISGHFDKLIRFWDTRTETAINTIQVQGKVTSLDLSRDTKYLLSCVRDDSLRVLDLRMNQIVGSFSHDGFKVGCDWSRAVFSSEGQYVAVGSSDGSIFIWNVTTGKVESILKDNHTSAVTAVAWHPFGNYLASVDRTKRAIVWADL